MTMPLSTMSEDSSGGVDSSATLTASMIWCTGSASAWSQSSAGAGFASGSAIGNQLNVITQGSWNTVIVNSTQINNGDISANSDGE